MPWKQCVTKRFIWLTVILIYFSMSTRNTISLWSLVFYNVCPWPIFIQWIIENLLWFYKLWENAMRIYDTSWFVLIILTVCYRNYSKNIIYYLYGLYFIAAFFPQNIQIHIKSMIILSTWIVKRSFFNLKCEK